VSGAARWAPVTATTETHHLVWGGEDGSGEVDRADGFAVHLASGTVEPIPHAPVTRLSETDGAWTGEELVVVSSGGCTSCGPPEPSAAAWHPDDGWRGVAGPPAALGGGTTAAVWTGTVVVVTGREGEVVAYDPAADRWEALPPLPGEAVAADGSTSLVWTGTSLVHWSGGVYAGPFPSEVGSATVDAGWVLDAGDASWRALPELPAGARPQLGTLVWTGQELVVWGAAAGGPGGTDVGVGARLRPGAAAWDPLAPSPQGPGEGFEGTAGSQSLAVDAATGEVVVVPLDLTGGTGTRDVLVLDPATGSWTTTDAALGGWAPTIAAVDGMLLVPHPVSPVAARLP
jgi:hypothetical protein